MSQQSFHIIILEPRGVLQRAAVLFSAATELGLGLRELDPPVPRHPLMAHVDAQARTHESDGWLTPDPLCSIWIE